MLAQQVLPSSPDMLPALLEEIFSFSLPRASYPPTEQKDRRLIGTTPFTLYDQHSSPSQSIQRVVLLPSILGDTLQVVDNRLAELKRLGQGPLPLTPETRADFTSDLIYQQDFFSPAPDSVAAQCAYSINWTCLNLVSSWVIHPSASQYYGTLWFDERARIPLPRQSHDDPSQDLTMRFVRPHMVHPEVLSSIDDGVKGALQDWCDRDLFTFLFLPMAPHTEALLRDLDRLATLTDIPSPGPMTRGCFPHRGPTPTTYDAEKSLWTLPPSEGNTKTADPQQFDMDKSDDIAPGPASPSILCEFAMMKNPTAEGIIHHVWNLAVSQDTTIIVINAGWHARIGIRHRATRTLYLSDIFDTTKPGYGKIHLGLQMAAVMDALDRYRQYRKLRPVSGPALKSLGKRPRKISPSPKLEMELRRSTRNKLNVLCRDKKGSLLSPRDKQILWDELDRRPIALLQFRDGYLQSSIPSCCIRTGGALCSFVPERTRNGPEWKGSYPRQECFTLTLISVYGQAGATGKVYKAQLEISQSKGRKLVQDVVAKVATQEESRKRLRHEYDVYQQLFQHGVRRVPEIYGLFQDHNDLADILVMERAKFSFRQREPWTRENDDLLKELTPSDKNACISIVKAIHEAGVVHRDLCAENLVIAQDGRPMVIDFERARFDPSEEDKENELEVFSLFLDGKTLNDVIYGAILQQEAARGLYSTNIG